jgi:putative membrane protein
MPAAPRIRTRLATAALAALVIAALLAPVAVSATDSAEATDRLTDDETVYAVLDSTGAVEKTVVVDWLSVEGAGTFAIHDPGAISSARALEEELEPTITDDGVTWELDVDGRRDFFYRAETEQALPLEVEARYFLDDVEMSAEEIAGRDGRLRIEVTATNLLERTGQVEYIGANGMTRTQTEEYWTPLLTVVALDLDGTKYTDIVEEADVLNVSGSTMSYTFMLFPQGEDTAVIEMTGTDIELPPFYVSAFPQMPGAPEIEIADTLLDLREGTSGLAELSEGHVQVLDGIIAGFAEVPTDELGGAAEDFALLGDGVTELDDGVAGLVQLAQGQYDYLDGVIDGIDTSQFDSLPQLVSAIESMTAGAQASADGLDQLIGALDVQIGALETLRASNASLASTAAIQAAADPADTTMTVLANGLAAQDAMIASALDTQTPAPGVEVPGLHGVRADLYQSWVGLDRLATGLAQVSAQAQALNAIPGAFSDLRDALVVLRDGGLVGGQPFPGFGDTVAGLQGVSAGLSEMSGGLEESEDLLADLETLPQDMAQLVDTLEALRSGGELEGTYLPGVATTVESLEAMSDGLAEGVNEARAGEALTGVMEDAADSYDTFLGKPRGAAGRVRFVMKLPGIVKPE